MPGWQLAPRRCSAALSPPREQDAERYPHHQRLPDHRRCLGPAGNESEPKCGADRGRSATARRPAPRPENQLDQPVEVAEFCGRHGVLALGNRSSHNKVGMAIIRWGWWRSCHSYSFNGAREQLFDNPSPRFIAGKLRTMAAVTASSSRTILP